MSNTENIVVGTETKSSIDAIFDDINVQTEGLEGTTLRPNPIIETGKVNAFDDVYPRWGSNALTDLFSPPTELIPITSAIDLTNGEIVITRMSFYEQRTQTFINGGGTLDKATEGDLNTQAEIDIALPGAVFGFVEDNTFVPHPMYTKPQLSRMRFRALVAYTKTRFNAPKELVMALHDTLRNHGFEDFVVDRERQGELQRRMLFNIQAPLVGNPTSIQMRLRQLQESGFKLASFVLVAPRPVEMRYRDNTGATRPEFEGFAWHLADNVRWATALLASGVDGLQAFSLTTALTGIDHNSQDATRPMGNALRATIQSVSYEDYPPDEDIRKALNITPAIPVTKEVRRLAANMGFRGTLNEINFFAGTGAQSAPAQPVVVTTPVA